MKARTDSDTDGPARMSSRMVRWNDGHAQPRFLVRGYLADDIHPPYLCRNGTYLLFHAPRLRPRSCWRLVDGGSMNPMAMEEIPNLQTVLTERQLEVVGLLANGHSSTQTSHILSINQSTVKKHIIRAMRRVSAQTRTQLVVLYVVWKLKAP